MSVLKLILTTGHLSFVFPMGLCAECFSGGQRLLCAVGDDGEMQWKSLGKGENKKVKLWYLLSHCPISACDVSFRFVF